MNQAMQTLSNIQLKQFAPLGKLSDDDAQELLRTSITVTLSADTPLFRNGNNDNQVFYLIEGKIKLSSLNKTNIIESGTNDARKPISHHSNKHATAIAVEQSTLLSFDADMLDLFLNWTNPNAYIVSEIENSKDNEWLNRLLKSRGLLRFSEQQINTLLDRMNEVHFNKGDIVISQDDNDEFYYVIKNGRATVSRKPSADTKEIKLAELCEGDAFGEESILTQSNRGATITMNEPGKLMRLSKNDFSELLAQPLLETISWNEAQTMTATGAAFIDIRLEEEFNDWNIPGSQNIPLPLLRLKLKKLNQRHKYIICCNDGSRSSVAAFLLNRHGFDAFILDGGMTTVISRMADMTMKKFLPETKSSVKVEIKIPTTEKISHTHLTGQQAPHQFEKNIATNTEKKETIILKQQQKEHQMAKSSPSQSQRNISNKLLRNTLLGVNIMFLASAFLIYFTTTSNTPPNNLSNTTTLQSTIIRNPEKTIHKTTTLITPETNLVTHEGQDTVLKITATPLSANTDL